jgi:hypothetical protein
VNKIICVLGPHRLSAAATCHLPNRTHIVSSHAIPQHHMQATLQRICIHVSFFILSVRVSHSRTHDPRHPSARHLQTSPNVQKAKFHENHMHLSRLPPPRLPTAPVFQEVTRHHAVCRVVGGVSSLRLHPLLTMIQVSGAEGRHCISLFREGI